MDKSDAKSAAMEPLAFGGGFAGNRDLSAATGTSAMASSPVSARRGRWTINGDFVSLQPTGVPRYAREVTMALDALVAERHPLARRLEIDLVAPRQPAESFQLRAIPMRIVTEFSRPRLPQFWVQAQLPWHVPGGLLSFCNLAPVAVKRQVACIHDMHTRLMPESYGRGFRLAHRLILPLLGRRAAHITTVSQLSRSHLVQFGIAPEEKITVTYNGSDHALRWDAARSLMAVRPERPYVLCIGRRDQKYKNLDLLLRLAPLLDTMGLELWMAGEADSSLIAGRPARNVRLLGRVSDDDLKKALSGALCFLFPSRIEGFGLPAVEAMACGCPVVASTSPCLPEVCGDAALYADPDDTDAWADAVRRIMGRPELRRQLAAAGRARARLYTWRGIAEIYLGLMLQVDAELG
jgi:glycosyltransferase involved in cell wall biosynthesis